ncbi:hypothetical protein AB6A40_009275 [Gnathostoma spinigerum]|uniref:Uncharacterized protein n=1 Tax=Gnathostoma spinigerum TaxID=75299 RepID=A0ABD6ERV0_9BILA
METSLVAHENDEKLIFHGNREYDFAQIGKPARPSALLKPKLYSKKISVLQLYEPFVEKVGFDFNWNLYAAPHSTVALCDVNLAMMLKTKRWCRNSLLSNNKVNDNSGAS